MRDRKNESDGKYSDELKLNWNKKVNQEADVAGSMLEKVFFCSGYSKSKNETSQCVKALDKIVSLMNPKDELSVVSVIQEVYRDKRYRKGMLRSAKHLLSRVKNRDFVTQGDLFSDLIHSYKTEGLTDSEADEHAWNILDVIATNGPDTACSITVEGVSRDISNWPDSIKIFEIFKK